VLGTLNNCGNGRTPWGTYLTCEENFNGYFGSNGALAHALGAGEPLRPVVPPASATAGTRRTRASTSTPTRTNPTVGWIVEIDPFDPNSKPVKRTALGRFKHENAALAVAANGIVAFYMGDDERNEYIYKFVCAGKLPTRRPRRQPTCWRAARCTWPSSTPTAPGMAGRWCMARTA
jgi:secreted PhoX family phosphatase